MAKKIRDALLNVLQKCITDRSTLTIRVGKKQYEAYVTYIQMSPCHESGVEEITLKMTGPAQELYGQPDVQISYRHGII